MTPRAIRFDEQANAFWFHSSSITGFRENSIALQQKEAPLHATLSLAK
jgi:hypothetical protein